MFVLIIESSSVRIYDHLRLVIYIQHWTSYPIVGRHIAVVDNEQASNHIWWYQTINNCSITYSSDYNVNTLINSIPKTCRHKCVMKVITWNIFALHGYIRNHSSIIKFHMIRLHMIISNFTIFYYTCIIHLITTAMNVRHCSSSLMKWRTTVGKSKKLRHNTKKGKEALNAWFLRVK